MLLQPFRRKKLTKQTPLKLSFNSANFCNVALHFHVISRLKFAYKFVCFSLIHFHSRNAIAVKKKSFVCFILNQLYIHQPCVVSRICFFFLLKNSVNLCIFLLRCVVRFEIKVLEYSLSSSMTLPLPVIR